MDRNVLARLRTPHPRQAEIDARSARLLRQSAHHVPKGELNRQRWAVRRAKSRRQPA